MPNNGELDAATLRVLPGFLPYAAANNFQAVTSADGSNLILAGLYTDAVNMAADFEVACHQPLTYAESYRSLATQHVRALEHTRGGPNAATPGYSNHGWAQALDYRNGIGGGPGNTTYDWMHAHAGDYGFVEDVPGEHWHWHHPSTTSITRPRTTTASTGGTTELGDDDMTPDQAQMLHDLNERTKNMRDDINHLQEGTSSDGLLSAIAVAFLNTPVDPKSNPPVGKVYQALRDARQGTFSNQSLLKKIAKKLGL